MEPLDIDSKIVLHERNITNGVAQRPDPIDEWLAMGASLVDDMRHERKDLLARVAVIDAALCKLGKAEKPVPVASSEPKRARASNGALSAPGTQAATVAAVVPKLRINATSSKSIAQAAGVHELVAQKVLSMLFTKNRVHRAKDINLLHGFLYWDAK